MKAGGGWLKYLGDQGSGDAQKFVFGKPGELQGRKWEWKHYQVGKYQEKGEWRLYHRERILETSTLSCNEEEEEITKPPKR